MSIRSRKMTASILNIRKLLGRGKYYQITKNKHEKSADSNKQNMLQYEYKTAEQCIWKSVILRRKENETFGFDFQTSSDGRAVSAEQALSLCVCWVNENSPAMGAGLKTGDVIITVNSVYIAGFTSEQVTDLMQRSSMLKMEIIRDATVKQRQLLVKHNLLQRELTEKCQELLIVITQEVRLSRGARQNNQSPTDLPAGSPATHC